MKELYGIQIKKSMPAPIQLEDLTFQLPHVWEWDWDKAYEEAEGTIQDLIHSQRRLAAMAEGVDGTTVTPERLAWLQLWVLHFILLKEARSAREAGLALSAQLLARTSFEASLHVMAIVEPMGGDYKGKENVFERLCAYAAWCLWQDLEYLEDLLDRRTLRGIYNPNLTRDLADELAADPEKKAWYETLFGSVTPVDPVDISRERTDVSSKLSQRRRQVEEWLRHPKLEDWYTRLKEDKANRVYYNSFFDLIGTARSVPRQLLNVGMRWAYSSFSKGSMYAHGTSIELFLNPQDKALLPQSFGAQAAEDGASTVSTIGSGVIILLLLRRKLWNGSVEFDSPPDFE